MGNIISHQGNAGEVPFSLTRVANIQKTDDKTNVGRDVWSTWSSPTSLMGVQGDSVTFETVSLEV